MDKFIDKITENKVLFWSVFAVIILVGLVLRLTIINYPLWYDEGCSVATAINSFKMDKDTLAAIGNTVTAFNQIHNVISGMSENFIKSILSLNPIKAWVLGKRLGKFYGILAQGMVGTFVKQIVDIIN